MIIFKNESQIRNHLEQFRTRKQAIGFVPTMGALHEGHVSLIKRCKNENDITVCSIFVNPTQFNEPNDFKKYPVKIEEDIYQLEKNDCDILFFPPVEEIYPQGTHPTKKYDLGYIETILEGEYRPGHFQGVCMVVERLLSIVQPDKLYLGQKDYQQCMVIKKLTGLMENSSSVNITICPIFREQDGLAMSSRNLRLNPEQRAKAPAIYETLLFLKENINKGSIVDIKKEAKKKLEEQGFKVDYVELADAKTLRTIHEWDARSNVIALIAASLNDIRLIDNMHF